MHISAAQGGQAMRTTHGMQTCALARCCTALSLAAAPGLQCPGLSAAPLKLVHFPVTSSHYLCHKLPSALLI